MCIAFELLASPSRFPLRWQDGKTAYDLGWDYDAHDGGEILTLLMQFNEK